MMLTYLKTKWLVLLLGFALAVWGLMVSYDLLNDLRNPYRTTGYVSHLTSYSAEIGYENPNGKTIYFNAPCLTVGNRSGNSGVCAQYSINQKVQVIYNPADPLKAHVIDIFSRSLIILFSLSVGVLLIILGQKLKVNNFSFNIKNK